MKELITQIKWQFIILNRNKLIMVSVAITVIYGLVFLGLKDFGNMDKFLTLLIYNDPALIGLFFAGLSIILEKNQQVLSALFVSPMNRHYFLISKIIALSIVGTLCALAMVIAVRGFSFHYLLFISGVMGTCMFFSILGIYLVCFTTDFLQFMLRSIPLLFFFSTPLLNYFELTNIGLFYYTPIQGSLNLIINAYVDQPVRSDLVYGFGSILFWIPLAYIFVYKTFQSRMVSYT